MVAQVLQQQAGTALMLVLWVYRQIKQVHFVYAQQSYKIAIQNFFGMSTWLKPQQLHGIVATSAALLSNDFQKIIA